MKRAFIILIIILLSLISGLAISKGGDSNEVVVIEELKGSELVQIEGLLSLEDAIKLALQYSRQLRIVIEGKEIAKGRIWEAYGEALPQISVSGSYTRLDEVLSFEFNGMRIDLGFLNNYSTSLNVMQPLYRGGRTGAAIRASKLYKALVDSEIKYAVVQCIYDTIKAYYDVLLAQQQVNVAEKYVKLTESHMKDVETKRRYGVASDFNVLRSQVELSNARAQYINYKHYNEIKLVNLLKTIGVSQDSKVVLSDQLGYNPVHINEGEIYKEALDNRQDLESLRLTVRLQDEAIKAANSNYFPSVDAFFNWALSKPDPHISMINEWGTAWRAGLSFSFTIFDGLKREGQLIRENATLRQYKLRHFDVKEQIRFEVNSAVKAIKSAAEALEVQKLTLEKANESLRLAEVGYREGILDQVSVLEARAALTQAQLLYYNSLYNYSMAKLELMKAIGRINYKDL